MKTVFVVDDDQEQAELLARALASKSRKVRAFSDPIRALAALNAEGADLLVADLSMPWIDGGDVVASARIRRPGLKVILVSGFSRGAQIARRYQIPFFSKPIDLDALRAATSEALGEGGATSHP
ncbi:MAG: response regulator [Deltaproteobacteria bacterium]|nr:response regulator [Deltaproteobacteria bacterium]